MPLYNFLCSEGPHVFELLQSMNHYNGSAKCPTHETTCKRTYQGQTAPAALNANSACGYNTSYSDYIQLGRTFTSAKEQDAFAESMGLMAISKDEHERGTYLNKGDDRRYEWETPAEHAQKLKDREAIKQETYSLIKNNGGVVTRDGTLYQLNDKNQLARQDDPNKILEIVPVKDAIEVKNG